MDSKQMKKMIVGCLLMASTTTSNALTPLNYVSLIFQGIYFSASESIPEEISITTKGVGDTQPIAIQNALNMAVEQTIGVLILSEQSVKNNTIVRNLVSQYSSGVVNSYEVKNCDGKPVSCVVTAKVSPWKFMRKLEGDSQTMQVNGNDLLAKHETAKNTLIQRYRMTYYYMSQIRQSGLDVKVKSVSVEPSFNNKVRLNIDYEVKWNKEFKKEIIRFLEKLEKDTVNNDSNNQVYIQWGPTGLFENRVRVNTFNEDFRRMMVHFIHEPIYVRINELGICENVRHDNVFTVDWYGVRRQTQIEVEPQRLKNVNKLSMGISC
jgi:hypothetical protein